MSGEDVHRTPSRLLGRARSARLVVDRQHQVVESSESDNGVSDSKFKRLSKDFLKFLLTGLPLTVANLADHRSALPCVTPQHS